MTALLRFAALRERLRASLWTWPAISVTAALLVGLVLPMLEERANGPSLGYAGSPEGARAVLSTVAGSTITVTGLTFSLTVVALQVASSQYTPQLMGTFLADRGNQAVLSVFLGTFTYTLAVLRSVRGTSEGTGAFVPEIAVAVGLLLTLLSVAMLVYFFHHLTQQLRVETVLRQTQRNALASIRRELPERSGDTEPAPPSFEVPTGRTVIRARRSGHLQAVDMDVLSEAATELGVVLRVRPAVGDHVTADTTLAWWWPVVGGGAPSDEPDPELLARRVHGGIQLGSERTLQQDIGFGVRQLVDIASRALSSGVNDPTTAVASLRALATVVVELAQRRLEPLIGTDREGRVRAVVPRSSFGELLALTCDQPRRYGSSDPAVLVEILRLLGDVAEVARDDPSRDAVRVEIDRTVRAAEGAALAGPDLGRVSEAAERARETLEIGARVAPVAAWPDDDRG